MSFADIWGVSLQGGGESKPEFGGTRLSGLKDTEDWTLWQVSRRAKAGGAVKEVTGAGSWQGVQVTTLTLVFTQSEMGIPQRAVSREDT